MFSQWNVSAEPTLVTKFASIDGSFSVICAIYISAIHLQQNITTIQSPTLKDAKRLFITYKKSPYLSLWSHIPFKICLSHCPIIQNHHHHAHQLLVSSYFSDYYYLSYFLFAVSLTLSIASVDAITSALCKYVFFQILC